MAIGRLSSKRSSKLKARAGLMNDTTNSRIVNNTLHSSKTELNGYVAPKASKGSVATHSILAGAMQQAEQLKLELDRAKTGIALLNHGMDRLGDVVYKDSLCCGGFFSSFWSLFRSGASGVTNKRSGGSSSYTSVELSDSDHHSTTSSSTLLDVSPLPLDKR